MGYHDDGTESYYGDEPDGEDPRGNRTSDFDSDFRAYHGTSRASHSNRNRTRKVSRRGPPDSSTARTFTRGTPDRRATDPTPGRKATVEDPLEHLKESKWAAIANRHIDLPPPDQHQSSLSARSSFKTRGDGSRVATIGVHREADAKLVIELDEETFTVGLDGRSRCFTVPCTTLVYQMNTRVTYDTSSRSAEEEDQWLANLNVFQVLDKMYPRIPQIIKEKMSEDAIEQALGWRDEVAESFSGQFGGFHDQNTGYPPSGHPSTARSYPAQNDSGRYPEYCPPPSSGFPPWAEIGCQRARTMGSCFLCPSCRPPGCPGCW